MNVILSEAEGSPIDVSSKFFAPRHILLASTGDPFDSLRSLRMTFLGSFGFLQAARQDFEFRARAVTPWGNCSAGVSPASRLIGVSWWGWHGNLFGHGHGSAGGDTRAQPVNL
jgi:hypothetical protein